MKKIVIAPDSFKGALPALDVANAIAAGIHRVWPGADCALLPMADGGEGTLDAVLSVSGVRQLKRVSGAAAGATRQTVRRPAREAAYGAAGEAAGSALARPRRRRRRTSEAAGSDREQPWRAGHQGRVDRQDCGGC